MRNSAALALVVRSFALVAPLLAAPLLARGLGVSGRGESAALTSLMILTPVLVSWGAPIVLRIVAAAEPGRAAAYVRGFRRLGLLASVVVAAVVAACFAPLSALLSPIIALSFLVSLPIGTFAGLVWIGNSSVLIGRGESVAQAVTLATPGVSYAIAVFCMWLADGLTVQGTIWAQAGSYVLTLAVSEAFVRVSPFGARVGLRAIISRGGRYAAGQIAEAASYRVDQVVVLPLLGAAVAGQYAVSVTVALLPSFVAQVIAMAAFSQSSSTYRSGADGDPLKLLRVLFIVGILASGGLAAVAPWLVPVVFGADFSDAVTPTLVGLIGAIFLALSQGGSTLLAVRERGWLISGAQIFGLVVALSLLMPLASVWGVGGVAAASTLGYLVTAVVMVCGLKPSFRDLVPRFSDVKALVGVLHRGSY